MTDWIQEEFRVNVITCYFDYTEASSRGRINIVVDTERDYQCFFTKENGKVFPFEEEYRKRILAHFRVLAKKYHYNIPRDTFVIYMDFSYIYRCFLLNRIANKIRKNVKRNFSKSPIYKITTETDGIYIFYKKDEDIMIMAQNGISEEIKKACFAIVKQYDEFSCFNLSTLKIKFDSQEYLEKHCKGSLGLYFR